MQFVFHYFKSIRISQWIFLAVLAMLSYGVSAYTTSSAFCGTSAEGKPGGANGRGCDQGYFEGKTYTTGANVLPPANLFGYQAADAFPSFIVFNVDTMMARLRLGYYFGTPQEKSGAAFIFNTMNGNAAAGTGPISVVLPTISNAEWDDLTSRLRGLEAAGKINFNATVVDQVNSLWQGNTLSNSDNDGNTRDGRPNDDSYFIEGTFYEPGIVIRDYNDNVIYKILRFCANPAGSSSRIPPPPNYQLTPKIDTINPVSVEAGSSVDVHAYIDNDSPSPSLAQTQWQLNQITVPPGAAIPHSGPPFQSESPSSVPPCAYFSAAGISCGPSPIRSSPPGGQPISNGFNITAPNITTDTNLPAGTRVCFVMSVQPAGSLNGVVNQNWRHSNPNSSCTTVGKKPKLQIQGGDVRVGDSINTSSSTINGRSYASWVEYGAFAVNSINPNFASGAGPGINGSPNGSSDWHNLTLANSFQQLGNSQYGHYTNALPFKASLMSQFTAPVASAAAFDSNLSNLDTGTYSVGDVTIGGSVGQSGNGRGRTIVINSSGTVTITGNIAYTGPVTGDQFSNPGQFPQVVVIANKIIVAENVTRVDAWLIASNTAGTGIINTCARISATGNPSPVPSASLCKDQLVINGPIVTDHLYSWRTYGAEGSNPGYPAEIYNLRPDAYIWGQLNSSGSGRAVTTYTTEAPPRF